MAVVTFRCDFQIKEVFKIYNLVIVDDELIAREILKKHIKTFCNGFEITGEFSDGREAIDFLKQNDADVVITDVRMPDVDGIELAKYIHENKPYIKVIIVSGYSEFKYAQEAMKYDVQYYLLKVIDTDEFIDVMKNVQKKLKTEKNTQEENNTLENYLYFYDLLGGYFSSLSEAKDAFSNLLRFGDFDSAVCEVIEIGFENYDEFRSNVWHYGEEVLKVTLTNVIKLINKTSFLLSISLKNEICTAVIFHESIKMQIQEEKINYELNDIFRLKSTILKRELYSLKEIYEGAYEEVPYENNNSEHEVKDEIKKYSELVKKTIDFIDENYDKCISREFIAEKMYVNNSYLGKVFKTETGKTILEYLVDLRMKKAIELLNSGKKADELCFGVGYNDIRNFRRAFKKYTGYSLGEYKEKYFSKRNGEKT